MTDRRSQPEANVGSHQRETPGLQHAVDRGRRLGERRRHVALVTHKTPYPPDDGFARRVFELVRRLAADYDITVITYTNPAHDGAIRELEMHVKRVVAVPHAPRVGLARRLSQAARLVSRTPHHAQGWRSSSLQRALDDVIATDKVDLVQLESSQLGWLRLPPHIPAVVDEHNVESQLLSRMAGSASGALRAYYRFEAMRYRRFEDRLWDRADACLATSDVDGSRISQRSPNLPVTVVPNAADVDGFAPSGSQVTPDSLLFVGLLEYRPNVDGIRYFIDQILPRIRRRRPSAELVVVGRGPEDLMASLSRPGVHLTGWVPDVRPYLAAASVVVVPLRVGSGTRLKVVDAMSMGKPIVSTSIGAEGLRVQSGKHLLLADSPEEFADAVVQLLAEEPLRELLGGHARELAVKSYSWDGSADALADAYSRILDGVAGPLGTPDRIGSSAGASASDSTSGLSIRA